MGFYFLIFNCFPFVCINLLVWLNPFLVNITQFYFLLFKRFYTFLHFLLYDIVFNDFKLYIIFKTIFKCNIVIRKIAVKLF